MTKTSKTKILFQKKMSLPCEKLSAKPRSNKKSSNPELKVRKVTKRKIEKTPKKDTCRQDEKRKPLSQIQSQSLELGLKGKVLNDNQKKRKELLETAISREDGKSVSLSQHLHDHGFSFESQVSMVGVKKVDICMINYLVALFFEKDDYPLIEDGLDQNTLKRICNKWAVITTILSESDPKVIPEQAVLNILKKQGFAYKSLIIFLDLFESSMSLNGGEDVQERTYPKYEDLKYPSPKSQFISDVLEVAKRGYICFEEFVKTFKKQAPQELSEWETLRDCLWQDIFAVEREVGDFEGSMVRFDGTDWKVVSDVESNSLRRMLGLVSLENPEVSNVLLIDNVEKNVFVLEEDMSLCAIRHEEVLVKDPTLSEIVLLNHYVKCMKTGGGVENKQAFMDSFRASDVNLNGKMVTLFNFLRSGQGGCLSSFEAINLISKCLGNDGGYKNRQGVLEALTKPEIDLDGKKVPLFIYFISDNGGGLKSSEAIQIIAKCVGNHGGFQSKQALKECFCKLQIDLDNQQVSLFTFLISEFGGGFSPSEAIQTVSRFIGTDGGFKNYQAFIECLNKCDIDFNSENKSVYSFFRSKYGGELNSFEAIRTMVRFVGKIGGAKNKQAFIESICKPSINLDGKWVSLYVFLTSGGLSVNESVQTIVKCLSCCGGTLNKQVLLDFFCKQEIDLDGERVSLYNFLISEKGAKLSMSEAVEVIAKCIGSDGGAKNKVALVECFCKEEIELKGIKVPLFEFLTSKQGGALSLSETINAIVKCLSQTGGSKNKQAMIACFSSPEINLDGKKVSLFTFLISKSGGGLRASEAIQILVKCIGHGGGSLNHKSLMACFCEEEIALDGKKVSLYFFLISQRGGGLSVSEAITVIGRCVGENGGSKIKQVLVECFCKKEVELNGELVSLYTFLCLNEVGPLISSEAIKVLSRCLGVDGGCKNKSVLLDCFTKPEFDIDGKKVSLYTFLILNGGNGLSPLEASQVIVKCLSHHGGSKNKQVLMECLSKKTIDLDGQKVSLYNFLKSESGGGLTAFESIQVISRCIGENGGSNNSQAFIEGLTKNEICLNGQSLSLFRFLVSDQGGGVSSGEAIEMLAKCMGKSGGAKNKKALIDCFNLKLIEEGGRNITLYEWFLSGNMTSKEATYLCFIFSVNRYVLSAKDVLCLFDSKKENGSVMSILHSLNISGYSTLLNLINKVLSYQTIRKKSKQTIFATNCQSLVDMFMDVNGFFYRKRRENPTWPAPLLAKMCVEACILYVGKNIQEELKVREKRIVNWISQFHHGYQLTKESLDIMMHARSLDELNLLLELCGREIERRKVKDVDADYSEESLKSGLRILRKFKSPSALKVLLKYESILLKWFDLKQLSHIFTSWWNSVNIDKSIHYFFENRKRIRSLIPCKDLKKVFVIYMELSCITSSQSLPLKISSIQPFFKVIEKNYEESLLKRPRYLYFLYDIFRQLSEQEKEGSFHEIVEAIPGIFGSPSNFKGKFLNRNCKKDWELLIDLIRKWDLGKENLTQDELRLLVQIRFQLQDDIDISWSNISRLEDCGKGCCVLNKTVYPNWVFALAFLQKIRSFLMSECSMLEQKEMVFFESYNDIEIRKYRFPLYKIQLHKDGFVFEGESVSSVERFYAQSGIDECIQISHSETNEIERSSDEAYPPLYQKNQEGMKVETAGNKALRKRKGTGVDAELPESKKMKLVTSQTVHNLYEIVSKRAMLTEKNCEIFMNGSSYLSETMMSVLAKKTFASQVQSEEVRERWRAFIQRYQNQEVEKSLKIFEKLIEVEAPNSMFVDPRQDDSLVFAGIEDLLMTPIPEFESGDVESFPQIMFDSIFNFWEQDFDGSEFETVR